MFGKISSPIDARHELTAGYTAADWKDIVGSAAVSMYVPRSASALGLDEALSGTSVFDGLASAQIGGQSAAARVRDRLRRAPVSVDVETLLEAERESA